MKNKDRHIKEMSHEYLSETFRWSFSNDMGVQDNVDCYLVSGKLSKREDKDQQNLILHTNHT